MITQTEFLKRINNLPKEIPSKTGQAFYSGFKLEGNVLHFYRVMPKTNWSLDVETLWNIYANEAFINTTIVKKITGGRVNSPSVAILMAIKCIDATGHRL